MNPTPEEVLPFTPNNVKHFCRHFARTRTKKIIRGVNIHITLIAPNIRLSSGLQKTWTHAHTVNESVPTYQLYVQPNVAIPDLQWPDDTRYRAHLCDKVEGTGVFEFICPAGDKADKNLSAWHALFAAFFIADQRMPHPTKRPDGNYCVAMDTGSLYSQAVYSQVMWTDFREYVSSRMDAASQDSIFDIFAKFSTRDISKKLREDAAELRRQDTRGVPTTFTNPLAAGTTAAVMTRWLATYGRALRDTRMGTGSSGGVVEKIEPTTGTLRPDYDLRL